MYHLGNIEIPVMNLFGSPEHPFAIDEVSIDFDPIVFHEQPSYPSDLARAKPYLLKAYFEEYGTHHKDNPMPRLCGYTQAGESANNERGNLTLHFMQTSFFTFLATNRSLDKAVIPRVGTNQTIRETYVAFPYTLESSVLANPLAVQVVVVSRNPDQTPTDQVIIRLRSQTVAVHRNCYQPSAAGYMMLASDHLDAHSMPNPFFTARWEAREEIANRLIFQPAEYKLIGIALRWEDLELDAYGYVETTRPVRDLLGDFRRDAYEGWTESIPFEPHAVFNHMAEHPWEAVGVLAMCAALLAHFPAEDVEAAAKQLPTKDCREYFEHHSNQ
jgi:hypothetical protein